MRADAARSRAWEFPGDTAGRQRHLFAGTVVAGLILLASTPVLAAAIEIIAADPGVMTPSLPSAIMLSFDDFPVGGLPSYLFNGGSLTGTGAVVDTSLVGRYAQPAGDATNYLSVSYNSKAGAVDFSFSDLQNYFGMYWGSIDSYNSVSFLRNHVQLATFSGTDVVSGSGLLANGGWQSSLSNRYVNFYLGSIFYNEVVLSTTDFAFEVDNVAFGDPPVSVSEPNSFPLLAFSLFGIALMRPVEICLSKGTAKRA
jgi:hypothetical protein